VKKLTTLMLSGLLVLSMMAGQIPAYASPNQESAPSMTAEDVEAFLDGVLPQQLERENIAGATVAVVKDGKLLFSKGYGYSDVASKEACVT
jgi:CubicO group peptidase (beta-lactamase class C family)